VIGFYTQFPKVIKISGTISLHVFCFSRVIRMTTPPPSPTQSEIPSDGTSRKTRQATRLRRLTARTLEQARATVSVNPATGRGSGPHKDQFHSYLGVVARDKIPIVHASWNDVPETLKNMIWDDILVSPSCWSFNICYTHSCLCFFV